MIRNERELKVTKGRIAEFERTLAALRQPRPDVHPIMHKAQTDAVESQLGDLRDEVADYEALRTGRERVLAVSSLDELPRALIRARIASGMTQKELGEKLGLHEQQVQRYEATEYESASLSRLREVVAALGVIVREDIFLPQVEVSRKAVEQRLVSAGVPKGLLHRRLFDPVDNAGADKALRGLETAQRASRVFGWAPTELIAGTTHLRPPPRTGAPAFKMPARTSRETVAALASYSRFITSLVVEATPSLVCRPVPRNAETVRRALHASAGAVALTALLEYLWQLGIPVIPLDESGGFHGAFWRFSGRNVILLKQRTNSTARWVFDLLHETYHAGAPMGESELEVLDGEGKPTPANEDEEEAAMKFAGDVLLGGRAEELATACVRASRGSVEALKRAVPIVAERERVDVGTLANYMAFRLALQDVNWWGAATNLQQSEGAPWRVARDFLLPRLDFSRLGREERTLLRRALEPMEDNDE